MIYRFFFLFLLTPVFLTAQKKTTTHPYGATDKLIDTKEFSSIKELAVFIDSGFPEEVQKARAIFSWISSHIDYSTDLMYTYRYRMETPDLAAEAFSARKAVCAGYAALFDTLAFLTGLHSEVIQGSTKQDFLPSVTGHCWNVVKLGGTWKIIDATWGSGYLTKEKYVRRRDESYFLAEPGKFIRTHLPFDPIWQLLEKPLSLYEFNARSASSVKLPWNFADSINTQLSLPGLLQLQHSARRLKEFGANSETTNNYYHYLQSRELEHFNKINLRSTSLLNEAVEGYNDYINYKNKQFQPLKPDAEIAVLLKPAAGKLIEAEQGYNLILNNLNEPEYTSQVRSNQKQLTDLKNKISEEQVFVDKYLGTKKNKRRNLFYTTTYTWFGIPIK
jgi:hypothetical protein